MSVYVDTSALVALLGSDDLRHGDAAAVFRDGLHRGTTFVTTNYAVSETIAVAQRRLGMTAVRGLVDGYLPAMTVAWVDESTHAAALKYLLGANRRDLSLADCVAFEVMRERGIGACFAFDRHFAEQGFEMVPAS